VPRPTGAPAPDAPELEGLAHVAAVSFLASRLVPSGQFWVALAGGIALGRAGSQHGLRAGYGASLAAMLETVALIGPARLSGPLTQALTAPLVGRQHARGVPLALQFLTCLAIRLVHYTALNLLFLWLVVGGIDEYVDSYDKIAGFLGFLPRGASAAIVLTIVSSLAWGCFYTLMQVLVYRRALNRWVESEQSSAPRSVPAARQRVPRRALAVIATAVVGCAALIASFAWPVLAAVAVALTILWLAMRIRDRDALRVGLALAGVLAVGAIVPVLLGVVDLETGAQRAVRAALLVLVATWARAALGTDGVRAVSSAALWRLRRLPAAAEGSRLTAAIASDQRLAAAGRSLVDALRDVPHKPLPVADAVATWVAAEADRAVRPHESPPAPAPG
jgi:hypothetical protein